MEYVVMALLNIHSCPIISKAATEIIVHLQRQEQVKNCWQWIKELFVFVVSLNLSSCEIWIREMLGQLAI